MKELYADLNKIVALDDLATHATLGDHLGKMAEEVGEFAKEANKLNGRKRRGVFETTDGIRKNLGKEAADAIQCILAITASAGVTYEQLEENLAESNQHYQEWVDEKVKKIEQTA
jgi:NTP pyrophosphatase (non-canonical NTP hydrolase)